MSRKDTDLYFTTVIADSPDLAFFGGHLYLEGAEPSLTRISMLKGGQWFHIYDIDDVVYAACKRAPQYPGDRGNLCFLGRRGFFREHPRGKQPIDTPLKSRIGYFYALKEIGQQLYAAGTQNQLFRHDGQAWVDADQGLYSPLQEQVSATLNGIDGFNADDLYAVGMGGAIWHWDGRIWTQLDSPTNVTLNSVRCSASGDVFIGGAGGILLRGNARQGWQDLSDSGVSTDSFELMTEFQDVLYIAARHSLLSFDGSDLRVCATPKVEDCAFFSLDASTDALWTVGNDTVMCFDGASWTHYRYP